jgi:hypothetical protein
MLQEVAILRRLRHPCICALFGHMRVDQRPALVLEYMAGGSLAAYLFNPRRASCDVDPPTEAVQSTVSSLNATWRRFTRASKSPFALDAASARVAPQASLGRQLMEPPPPQHLAWMAAVRRQKEFEELCQQERTKRSSVRPTARPGPQHPPPSSPLVHVCVSLLAQVAFVPGSSSSSSNSSAGQPAKRPLVEGPGTKAVDMQAVLAEAQRRAQALARK